MEPIDFSVFADTELEHELPAIAAGLPWATVDVAGLQFYEYFRHDKVLEKPVKPIAGDRVSLMRRPDNPYQ